MAHHLSLLGMTAILTILIWAGADSLVNDTGSVTVNLALIVPPGVESMVLDPGARTASCEVQLAGPRKTLEFAQRGAPWQVRFVLPELPVGMSNVPLDRSVIKRQLSEIGVDFKKLSVLGVQPAELPVVVDHWTTREVQVVIRRLTLAYDVEPQLQRASVSVKMRESRLGQIPPGEALQIDIGAELENILKDQPEGQSVTVPVTLDPRPFGPEAELTPNTVQVTATVKAERTTTQIPTVPVLVAVSFANLESAVRAVTRDGSPLTLVTQTITVTGPTDEVTRLARGVTRAHGIIQLKQQDFEELNVPKLMQPEFHLPPGITLADDPPPIEFKLIQITDTEKRGESP